MAAFQAPTKEPPPLLLYGSDQRPDMIEWELDIARYIRPLMTLDLPEEDGIPMETNWHRSAMNLLIDSVHARWHDRSDYFAGGNMFIHYSLEQVLKKAFLGPDFFVVKNVDGTKKRGKWTVWEEHGRYPDVIVELTSPSTIKIDLRKKKQIYEHTFHTSEYFCYTPDTQRLQGWQLAHNAYVELEPNDQGWLWSRELHAWMGTWHGEFQTIDDCWLRLYHENEELVLTLSEAEAQRATAAESEITRLKALLSKHGISAES